MIIQSLTNIADGLCNTRFVIHVHHGYRQGVCTNYLTDRTRLNIAIAGNRHQAYFKTSLGQSFEAGKLSLALLDPPEALTFARLGR